MQRFRRDGHFPGFEPLICADDAEAIAQAKRLVGDNDVELWSGGRLVIRLEAKTKWRSAATHRRSHRPYKTRVRMPSKLDPHIAAIEGWLADQPQLTALAIVGGLREKYPEEFGARQHSIVRRLLRALRRKAAEQMLAQEVLGETTIAAPLPGAVDGSGYVGPDPPQPLSSSKPGKPPGAADRSKSNRPPQWRHQGNICR